MTQYSRLRQKKVKTILYELVDFYKEVVGCADCGEHYLPLLDFHHLRDSKTKRKGLKDRVTQGHSFESVFSEIRKCVVLCVRCHRIREFKKTIKEDASVFAS
jgi:hypothetical protein